MKVGDVLGLFTKDFQGPLEPPLFCYGLRRSFRIKQSQLTPLLNHHPLRYVLPDAIRIDVEPLATTKEIASAESGTEVSAATQNLVRFRSGLRWP